MTFRFLTCAVFLALSFPPHHSALAQEDPVNIFYQEVIAALSSQPGPVFPVESQALIAFTVADDGTLETVSVAESSGSAPLDAAALEIVRNAAPFPQPPEGANRSLSIAIRSTRPTLSFGN